MTIDIKLLVNLVVRIFLIYQPKFLWHKQHEIWFKYLYQDKDLLPVTSAFNLKTRIITVFWSIFIRHDKYKVGNSSVFFLNFLVFIF